MCKIHYLLENLAQIEQNSVEVHYSLMNAAAVVGQELDSEEVPLQ